MKTGKKEKEKAIKTEDPKDLSGKFSGTAREVKPKGRPDRRLNTVTVPDSLEPIFLRAQDYVDRYFQNRQENPQQGQIEISGERYVLVRAASMSREFLDLVTSLYKDRGEKEARNVAFGFLFDMAHAIGKADAKSFYTKMGVSDPIEKLSAGPIHFAYTGWASVKIYPESHPTPDENYFLIYDHPFSFEANTWMKKGKKIDFSVCIMSAGYSSGWCEESFGIPLVAVEIECRAKGDEHCRFLMAPPSRIEKYIEKYSTPSCKKPDIYGTIDVPEFFQRKRLEDELLKSEETVRALLNAPDDRALLLDAQGNILAINKTAAKALGRSIEELIGLNAFDLIPPHLAKERKTYHDQVIRTGRSLRYEDLRDDRCMDTTIDPVQNAQGKVARVAVVSRDMTDYMRMQEALRKEKEFNATLIKTSPALFVAIAANGQTLLVNEAMVKALGYTQEEVIGKNYLNTFVPETERYTLRKIFEHIPTKGTTAVNVARMVTKDGREIFVEWHSRHVLTADKELDFFFALGIDITERKRAEDELRRHQDHLEDLVNERTTRLITINKQLQKEIAERKEAELALQKSETMLRGIFDQTFQFIGILMLDGTVVKINKTAMDIVKTNEAELVGKPFRETPWWNHSEKEQKKLQAAIGKAAQGRLVRFETLLGGLDGQFMHIDFSIKPLRDEKGKIVRLIAEGRDITEFKMAMEDLRKREAELKTQSGHLEEANIALKIVLKQMEEKKREDKENILTNLKQGVVPYLNRFKKSPLSTDQKILVDIVEKNLNNIASPLVSKLSSTFLHLTPMEIRIATLIKEGLMNKEITELLGTSLNTVSSHRFRIRSKLGLKKKGANLRSYLLSLDE